MSTEITSINVLIVDDLPDNRTLLRLDLEDEIDGISVEEAASGFEALDLIRDNEYDVVVCDLMMPGMDGIEVMEQTQKMLGESATLPFVFISANKQKESQIKALKYGAIDYLTKPYDLYELINKVKNLAFVKRLNNSLQKANHQLEHSNEHLRDLNQQKDEVLRIESHDMRNPLNNIIGLSNVLKEEGPESAADLRFIANVIERNAETLLTLVNSLLEVARIESGSITVESEKTNVSDLIEEVAGDFEALAKKKNLQVRLPSGGRSVHATLDGPKIKQVLGNLFSNAVKFSTPGGKISISSGVGIEDGKLFIRISDSGIGIPEDMMPHLFKKFSKAQRKGTNKERGTGLGLSIVKRFMDLHEGEVTVQSTEGKGTVFTLWFPRKVVVIA